MSEAPRTKVRAATLRQMKAEGRRIAAVTAYDAITAAWADAAGVDFILVGDSLGKSTLGLTREFEVRLEQMLHHCAAVTRGSRWPLRVGDMPFMTYKISPEQALATAARMVQEGGMEAVKLEGGAEMAPTVLRLTQAGVPVLAHIGLLPQSFHAQGGYKIQGRNEADAARLAADARALEEAGAFGVVLEVMPAAVARHISEAVAIPTIGIGAGAQCDGQILVISDLLGLTGHKAPKLAKTYVNLRELAEQSIRDYAEEVRNGKFPGAEQTYDA